MNSHGDVRFMQIDHENLNRDVADLTCPYCEAYGTSSQITEDGEHPRRCRCRACGEEFHG
jgi:hypothetical protein